MGLQPWAFPSRWIVGAPIGAAVVPDPYRLQAGNADDATSFENHSMFHWASLKWPPDGGNGLFGAEQPAPLARSGSYWRKSKFRFQFADDREPSRLISLAQEIFRAHIVDSVPGKTPRGARLNRAPRSRASAEHPDPCCDAA
jgi:hypothetical protein